MAVTVTDPLKIVLAILLPPLGVFGEVGFSGHYDGETAHPGSCWSLLLAWLF
jgi:hypothetical protein